MASTTTPNAAERAQRGRDWDEAVGTLAPEEIALLDPHTVAIGNAYERALVAVREARTRLITALTGEDSHMIFLAIDFYAVSSIALWRTAEAVCDVEDLANRGEAQGIIWTVPMFERDSPAQAGARLADDHFCQLCGRRGVRGTYCAECERCDS